MQEVKGEFRNEFVKMQEGARARALIIGIGLIIVPAAFALFSKRKEAVKLKNRESQKEYEKQWKCFERRGEE